MAVSKSHGVSLCPDVLQAVYSEPFKRKKSAYFFPVRGSDMLRVNEFQLYELAIHIHPLTMVNQDVKYSQVWTAWTQAKEALQSLFKQRSLEVCFGIANELYNELGKFVPDDWNDAFAKFPPDLSTEQPLGWGVFSIRNAAERFETIISAELSNSDTYWISPKGTHKTSVLLQFAHLELPPSVVKEMPEVKGDFDEAGKCLLFDTSTAAGFHLLRATESVIRRYYKMVTGKEPKTRFRNWGVYIKKLNEAGANKKITQHLDHMRENYRNPILHPEVNLSPDEAQVLFGVCVSAIFLMANEIKELNKKAIALTP